MVNVYELFTNIINQLRANTTTLSGLGDAATKEVVNNLERTTAGAVLDARQGQQLKEYVDENKVDKTTPLLNLDTTAAASTVDGQLTAALTALWWLNDVIES